MGPAGLLWRNPVSTIFPPILEIPQGGSLSHCHLWPVTCVVDHCLTFLSCIYLLVSWTIELLSSLSIGHSSHVLISFHTKQYWHICKGVHSLMPDLGRVVNSNGLVCLCPGFHQRYERARWDKRIGQRRDELCSDWRTPSWRLGVPTSILLIHLARGHIGLCYCTNS